MSAIAKTMPVPPPRPEPIEYPDSDGKRMADNTVQYRWMQTLQGNLATLFRHDPNVFVAADLLWYPVEGFPEIRNAPDVMVIFGRPKGDRGSYKQWEEAGIAPQVVFEILSPGNSAREMLRKLEWYAEREVEEYYVYDPKENDLLVYRLEHDWLRPVRFEGSHDSKLLKIRFDLSGTEMVVYYPDGRRFLTFEELADAREQADKRADDAIERAAAAARLSRRLAELGRKARRGEASAEELAELERLEAEADA